MYKIHMINAIKDSMPKKRENNKFMFLQEYMKLCYANVKIKKELV